MTTTTTTDVTFADGSGWTDSPYVTVGHPHHTSILSKNPGTGAVTVLEQNYKGNKEAVRSSTIRWKSSSGERQPESFAETTKARSRIPRQSPP